jgi:GNAT superfamily N-acetyltransferase
MTIPDGTHILPRGKLANVVTCLEMTALPKPRGRAFPPGLALAPADRRDLAAYRALFAEVGADYLWFSRLVMPDAELARILGDARYEPYVLRERGRAIGILDLDFREPGACELKFFGLIASAIGTGAGAALMDAAIARAWSQPIARFWVHTDTHDHPSALGFYLRSGFRVYERRVEVHDDPRLTGHLPRTAAPQIPLLEAR